LDIASRNGQSDTRMVMDGYGHLFNAADAKVSAAMDSAFDRLLETIPDENGRKIVVNATVSNKEKTRKPLRAAGQSGGDVRIRTADPLHAKKKLCEIGLSSIGEKTLKGLVNSRKMRKLRFSESV